MAVRALSAKRPDGSRPNPPGRRARIPRPATTTPKCAKVRRQIPGASLRLTIAPFARMIWVKAENAGKDFKMKSINSMKAGFAALAVTTLLLAAPASAETHWMRFQVPFQFTAGNEVMPAGQYEVVLDEFPHILLRNLRDVDVHAVALSVKAVKRSSSNLGVGTLRFEAYGGEMYLTAAWARGHEDGLTLRPAGKLLEAMNAGFRPGSRPAVILHADL